MVFRVKGMGEKLALFVVRCRGHRWVLGSGNPESLVTFQPARRASRYSDALTPPPAVSELFGCGLLATEPFLIKDRSAEINAVAANENFTRAFNKRTYFAITLAAKRTAGVPPGSAVPIFLDRQIENSAQKITDRLHGCPIP
jgi:hypothetical protein